MQIVLRIIEKDNHVKNTLLKSFIPYRSFRAGRDELRRGKSMSSSNHDNVSICRNYGDLMDNYQFDYATSVIFEVVTPTLKNMV